MSETIDSTPWWQKRLDKFESEGFHTKKIRIKIDVYEEQATTILEQYENLISISLNLKEEIERLPNYLDSEKEALLIQIKNAEDINKNEDDFKTLISIYFPWRLAAKQNKILWETAGKRSHLNDIVERLNLLDKSMGSKISDLLPLFEVPEKHSELLKGIINLENKQSERVATLNNMASFLLNRGFKIENYDEMGLEERFESIKDLQILDEKHVELERRINLTIGRFDNNLAIDYNKQRGLLTNPNSEIEFEDLIERIKNSEKKYLSRLEKINTQFSLWNSEGFNFNIQVPVLADELLERETQVAKVSDDITEYKFIWERLQKQYSIWPEEEAVSNIIFGNVFEKDQIEKIVIELEKRSDLVKHEAISKITRWKNKGFKLEELEKLSSENPVFANKKLEEIEVIFERITNAKLLLESLDTSFDSKNSLEKKKWLDILNNTSPNNEKLNELEYWISIVEKRNIRHRKMLQNELLKQGNKVDTNDLNLEEFEKLVKQKEKLPNKIDTFFNSTLMERLLTEIDFWIEKLNEQGWDTKGLIELRIGNPNKLMKLKGEIDKDIEDFQKLVERLESLPWGKDPEMGKEIMGTLKKPELLRNIKNLIPQYMQLLANSETEIKGFEFVAWSPKMKNDVFEQKMMPQAELIIDENNSTIDKKGKTILKEEITKSEKSNQPPSNEKKEVLLENNKSTITTKNERSIEIDNSTIKQIDIKENLPNKDEWMDYINALREVLIQLGIAKDIELSQTTDLSSLSGLRKQLAKFVGVTPRDSRVGRLLRILLRVIPLDLPEEVTLNSLIKIIKKINKCANKLNKWTSKRLERRHSKPSGGLLKDSHELGMILEKIPSPGFSIPLKADDYDLPSILTFEDLTSSVNNLEKYVFL